jgi:MFS family permease
VLALEGGAIAGLPAGGALVGRRGGRAVLRLGFAAYAAALAAVAAAPSLASLAASLAAMAFANSLVDVAMNVQGVELERRERHPLLATLHAGHAFGVLAGGAAGTVAAAAGIPVEAHFAATAATALAAGEAAAARLPAGRKAAGDEPSSGADATGGDDARFAEAAAGETRRAAASPTADERPRNETRRAAAVSADDERPRAAILRGGPGARLDPRLARLGAVAFCAFLLDGAAYAWIAVHVRDEGGSPALAAGAFTGFALALGLGRLAADRLVERHGRRLVIRGGAAVAATGIAAALLAPAPAAALAGWAMLGAGLAPIAPSFLAAAPGRSKNPAPAAIAAVSTVGYLGSFTGPPLIGALAGPLGLSGALGIMIVAALAAAALE